ncbi:pentapeptide repeat-containing protein [Desulfogranum mediterraneum]|uniref:pentapeptide repeat-containing protein n=1 Tax=Desulfogranum mediterraneum TaxID=160661 RepID=UPI00068789E6|nr:pentapeptide repeat-containing protein [Desulfogranum mediterraneum]
MKYSLFAFSCLVVGGLAVGVSAAPLGSTRPPVQENFKQLVATRQCPGCDLAGAVMTRMDLAGANLAGANLAGAKLFLADLSGANLQNSNLQGAALGGADLAGADLRGANLTGAVLEGAFLDTALIDGAIVTRRQEEGDDFSGSGEKVHVPEASRSKRVPYTQEVGMEPSPGAADEVEEPSSPQRAALSAARQPDAPVARSQAVQPVPGVSAEQDRPKQSGLMAAAVVPAAAVITPARSSESPPAAVAAELVLKEEKKRQAVQPELVRPPVPREAHPPAEPDALGELKVLPAGIKTGPAQAPEVSGERTAKQPAASDGQLTVVEAARGKVPVAGGLTGVVPVETRQAVRAGAAPAGEELAPLEPVAEPVTEEVTEEVAVSKALPATPDGVSNMEEFIVAEERAPGEEPAPKPAVEGDIPRAVSLAEMAAQSKRRTSQEAAVRLPQDKAVKPPASSTAPGAGGNQEGAAPLSVSGLLAGGEAGQGAGAKEASPQAVYTVETPDQAQAREARLIERLFDEERCVECNLSGLDLSGKGFKKMDLERVNLSRSTLQGADFRGANLKGANFQGADLRDADFREADLYHADFTEAQLGGARFEEALVDSADFSRATGLVLGEEQQGE